jgi:hypothetical protein
VHKGIRVMPAETFQIILSSLLETMKIIAKLYEKGNEGRRRNLK